MKKSNARRFYIPKLLRFYIPKILGNPPQCTTFNNWESSQPRNTHLVGHVTDEWGRSTEEFPAWPDTFDDLDTAKIACIEGLRVKKSFFMTERSSELNRKSQ